MPRPGRGERIPSDVMTTVSLIISVLALVAGGGATYYARHQAQTAKRASLMPAVIDLFREYRDPEMVSARRSVYQDMPGDAGGTRLAELPEPIHASAIRVAHMLDNVGLLVAEGLIPPPVAAQFFGPGVVGLWVKLRPCILLEIRLAG